MLLAPVLAMIAVALGLDVGGRSDERTAIVYGAARSAAGTGLAWQLATLEVIHGAREPSMMRDVEAVARAGDRESRWTGATNEDGVAELRFDLPRANPVTLEVRAGGVLLAMGRTDVADGAAKVTSLRWAQFARRQGPVLLDVAVLGQRVGSGFPATIWVRATDAATGSVIASVAIDPVEDSSLASARGGRTDPRGWARVEATPMGHAVALFLHARAPDGRTGEWAGALLVSPGAFELVANDRYRPDEEPRFEVVAPNLRTVAYVEIDDASGRAWGAAVPLEGSSDAMPRATLRAPRLAPGLYWAVASGDPAGAASMGPGTIARPFFVAPSDEAALAFGPDRGTCAAEGLGARVDRAVGACLAVTEPQPVPRWKAIEGLAARRAKDVRKRVIGLSLALGAILAAVVLETILLLRSAHAGRARLRAVTSGQGEPVSVERGGNVVVALLVALLGFALLAALLIRAA